MVCLGFFIIYWTLKPTITDFTFGTKVFFFLRTGCEASPKEHFFALHSLIYIFFS